MRKQKQLQVLQKDYFDRVNPQFIGISSRYIQKKNNRKSIEQKQHSLSLNVGHLQKINDQMRSTLNKKQIELHYLKEVRERYLDDVRKKEQRQALHSDNMEQLRSECYQSKTKNIQNIQDALDQIKQKKMRATNQVKNTLIKLKGEYSLKKSRLDQFNHSLFEEIQELKEKGREKINKFYQKKNKKLLKYYKKMLNSEEQKSQRSLEEVEKLEKYRQKFETKLSKKQEKLLTMEKEIEQIKKGSFTSDFGNRSGTIRRGNHDIILSNIKQKRETNKSQTKAKNQMVQDDSLSQLKQMIHVPSEA